MIKEDIKTPAICIGCTYCFDCYSNNYINPCASLVIATVKEMRRLQKLYFKTREKELLKASKYYENKVDKLIENYSKHYPVGHKVFNNKSNK